MSEVENGNRSKVGLILFGVTGGAGLLLSAACVPFVLPAFRRICLPYVPATTEQIENVLTALGGRSGRLIDLGSGDGRIVISAARAGFRADGIELNPWLVIYSKLSALRSGVGKFTNFYRKNIWNYDLQPYPNVVIFGVEEMVILFALCSPSPLEEGFKFVDAFYTLGKSCARLVILSGCNRLACFQMGELEKKFVVELQDGACIVACRFPLPTLKPAATFGSGIDTVWLYKLKSSKNTL